VLTQIYEASTPGEARLISKIGVDHIGILVGKGEFPPRAIGRDGSGCSRRGSPAVEGIGAVPDRRPLSNREMYKRAPPGDRSPRGGAGIALPR
jgi:hypothetical protein